MVQILVATSIILILGIGTLCHLIQAQRASSIYKISIGFVYCEPEELLRAEEVVSNLNKEKENNQQKSLVIEIKPYKLTPQDNTISLSLAVCDKLMGKEPLYAVVMAHTNCIKVVLFQL